MITRSELNRLHKADLHFMRGDRAKMAAWLDSACQHPYIGVSITYKGSVVMCLTTRVENDAGVSVLWQQRGMLDQNFTLSQYGTKSNADFLTGTVEKSEPRAWYVVFDDPRDCAEFKRLFRKEAGR